MWLIAIHPGDTERVLADLAVEKFGQPFEHEYRIVRPDGTIRWVHDRGFPVRDETGLATRYTGVAQDITERKQAEAKIAEQLDELKRWSKIMRGREMRIMEVKREVNALLAQAGEPPRYPSVVEPGETMG